jgi:preprotein translocase subunit Sss1
MSGSVWVSQLAATSPHFAESIQHWLRSPGLLFFFIAGVSIADLTASAGIVSICRRSEYAREAIRRMWRGARKPAWSEEDLTLPSFTASGYDPVPARP